MRSMIVRYLHAVAALQLREGRGEDEGEVRCGEVKFEDSLIARAITGSTWADQTFFSSLNTKTLSHLCVPSYILDVKSQGCVVM
jgi:hypothetical protein